MLLRDQPETCEGLTGSIVPPMPPWKDSLTFTRGRCSVGLNGNDDTFFCFSKMSSFVEHAGGAEVPFAP